jgi:hypothetical protein
LMDGKYFISRNQYYESRNLCFSIAKPYELNID